MSFPNVLYLISLVILITVVTSNNWFKQLDQVDNSSYFNNN